MPQREGVSKPEVVMISLAALSFGELPTRTSKGAAKPMVSKNQELCFHGHDCLPWLCSGPSGVPQSAREVRESLGSISPSPGIRTTRKSERLISGLRSWVPRHLAGTQVGTGLALVTSPLLILVHVQHPHAKWLKYLVLPGCPSSPPYPYSRNPGLFHPNPGPLPSCPLLPALD